MENYDKQLNSLRHLFIGRRYYKAYEAITFAQKYHTGFRKDGVTPEFTHQIIVTNYLVTLEDNLLYPEPTFCAALLHDVVEDYNVTVKQIEDLFGTQIADAVDNLSKVVDGVKKSPDMYFHKLSTDPIGSLGKGSDRIHNFQSMPGVFNKEKQLQYIAECEEYILPMLKTARKNFPQQIMSYYNIKHILKSQMELLRLIP